MCGWALLSVVVVCGFCGEATWMRARAIFYQIGWPRPMESLVYPVFLFVGKFLQTRSDKHNFIYSRVDEAD